MLAKVMNGPAAADMVGKDTKGTGKPGMPRDTASCESCHGHAPHPPGLSGFKLNDHTDRVACETCHIPTFARGGVATKVSWDWRTAGRLKDGQGFKLEGYTQGDGKHRHTYKSIKGRLRVCRERQADLCLVQRRGRLHNHRHQVRRHSQPLIINRPRGSADDRMRASGRSSGCTVQPHDKATRRWSTCTCGVTIPDAFWGNYDFQRAITRGMAEDNIPYSGEYDFIDTYSYWPINHMVAPRKMRSAAASAIPARASRHPGRLLSAGPRQRDLAGPPRYPGGDRRHSPACCCTPPSAS